MVSNRRKMATSQFPLSCSKTGPDGANQQIGVHREAKACLPAGRAARHEACLPTGRAAATWARVVPTPYRFDCGGR
jgi:hypothetical protein